MLKNLQETGSLDYLTESGRPHTSHCSCDNFFAVEELAQIQEIKSHTHLSTRRAF